MLGFGGSGARAFTTCICLSADTFNRPKQGVTQAYSLQDGQIVVLSVTNSGPDLTIYAVPTSQWVIDQGEPPPVPLTVRQGEQNLSVAWLSGHFKVAGTYSSGDHHFIQHQPQIDFVFTGLTDDVLAGNVTMGDIRGFQNPGPLQSAEAVDCFTSQKVGTAAEIAAACSGCTASNPEACIPPVSGDLVWILAGAAVIGIVLFLLKRV